MSIYVRDIVFIHILSISVVGIQSMTCKYSDGNQNSSDWRRFKFASINWAQFMMFWHSIYIFTIKCYCNWLMILISIVPMYNIYLLSCIPVGINVFIFLQRRHVHHWNIVATLFECNCSEVIFVDSLFCFVLHWLRRGGTSRQTGTSTHKDSFICNYLDVLWTNETFPNIYGIWQKGRGKFSTVLASKNETLAHGQKSRHNCEKINSC